MGRGIRASAPGLETAKQALKRKGWTQDHLAGRAGCSRQTVSQFFARKAVDKRFFQAICLELELEWGEIAEFEPAEKPDRPLSLDELVEIVRINLYDSIQTKCGSMRVLDMSQPVGLGDIYTTVNVLEKITGRRRLELSELWQGASLENFDRFILGGVQEKRVPGLEAVEQHTKLMILGKPGAGKTTFLKYLALQCIEKTFKPDLVPLFITLRDFAGESKQSDLFNYITQKFIAQNVDPTIQSNQRLFAPSDSNATAIEQLLRQGRGLVLLDGLDEVREEDNHRILKQIQDFTNQFHKNLFVITCRIAAREYTFEQFTEVEVADFDDLQIASFATKWFQAKQDLMKADRFIERLKTDQGIRELAISPILLTLLCIVFEESGSFPSNRSELYKEGLDVLLKKWDAKRNIERDNIYKKLSLKRKEDLLSQIALETFEQGNYFFKQGELERYITQYIRNLPDASPYEEDLHLDSEAILKSIEAQHGLFVERARGIYSFSHLTFHEYFTARKIVLSANADALIHSLASHVTEKRWREVFLLTVGMLENADTLLQRMKYHIDILVAEDQDLRRFLTWLKEKSESVGSQKLSAAAIRAFYFALDRDLPCVRALDHTLDCFLISNRERQVNLILDHATHHSNHTLIRDLEAVRVDTMPLPLALDSALQIAHLVLACRLIPDHASYCTRLLKSAFDPTFKPASFSHRLDLDLDLYPILQYKLKKLKDQLPNISASNQEDLKQWWQKNGDIWSNKLRSIIIEHRNIGHDWQFSPTQIEQLQKYHDANQLLVDCLRSECYVSREVRQKIESAFYMPIDQLEE